MSRSLPTSPTRDRRRPAPSPRGYASPALACSSGHARLARPCKWLLVRRVSHTSAARRAIAVHASKTDRRPACRRRPSADRRRRDAHASPKENGTRVLSLPADSVAVETQTAAPILRNDCGVRCARRKASVAPRLRVSVFVSASTEARASADFANVNLCCNTLALASKGVRDRAGELVRLVRPPRTARPLGGQASRLRRAFSPFR